MSEGDLSGEEERNVILRFGKAESKDPTSSFSARAVDRIAYSISEWSSFELIEPF
jgi:hypothetical protein